TFADGNIHEHETEVVGADGRRIDFWCTASVASWDENRRPKLVVEISRDITERKRVEEALRESDGRYRNILESVEEGYFEVDIAGNFTFFNNSLCKILGYPKGEMMGMNNRQYADKENTKKLYETFNKVYKTGKPEKGFDWEIIRKDGTKRYIEASVSLLKDAGDKPIGFRGIVRDVTERKKVEEALRESERKYRNIFENIQDVYYESTLEGIILEISPSIENVSKYTRKELIGKSAYDFYTNPEERDELLKAVLVSGKVDNFEIHLTDIDGSQHLFELNMTLHRDQKGNPIKLIGSMRDISERKRFEARLHQSQKMETVGALAGGIAHEFNNILGTIIGNTELAIGDVPEGNPARDCLKEIQTASLRAKDVVRQILGFAGKSVFQLMPVQISPIVSETLKLIRASIPKTIEIRRNLSCKSDTVMADPTQINQVLMNLCINAKNAMQEKGGVLEVKLENTSLDERSATRYEDLSPGNYVKLTVKDSGHGIDPKNIDRIFDPYFTTTSLAEGPGMGLAVVYGIVKHHNGAITVASEPGKGTVFEVLFPLTEAEAEQETGEQEALPTGNEKILFVDDEASLVKMAKRMLEMQGYQVETKTDPVEALGLFRSEPDRFDLIITDMTMPKMTGDKLAKEILSIRPDMPIILCSGFSEKIDAEKAKELGISKYIEKPLYMSDFVVTVREVLDK
ncbi:MAG: PAS domain S-box protein, partial [Deltaproteobacteria bacterium]|nr:PAS domain S-box protein [Deltaproteobacteria bacterium]